MGPLEVVVLGFPHRPWTEAFQGDQWTGAVQGAIRRAEADGHIRVIDALVVTKERDGTIGVVEFNNISGLEDEAATMLAAGYLGLVEPHDVEEVGTLLAPGGLAAVLVVEHLWAVNVQKEIVAAGGTLLCSIRIPRSIVVEAEYALATRPGGVASGDVAAG